MSVIRTLLLYGLALSLIAGCQRDMATPATSAPVTAFFAVSVADLDRSVAWYSAHLGFTLESQSGNDERRGALLKRPDALLEITEFGNAVPLAKLDAERDAWLVHGIFKIGFVVADLEQRFAGLEAAGVDVFFPIVAASDGQRTFAIRDPDGNIVQFFGP